jgi:hypothetical protein
VGALVVVGVSAYFLNRKCAKGSKEIYAEPARHRSMSFGIILPIQNPVFSNPTSDQTEYNGVEPAGKKSPRKEMQVVESTI